jgi:ketosteroid isomerase-like protein
MSADEFMKLYEAKLNLHRFEDVEDLISPQALFWFNDGAYRGIDEIKAAFERTWKTLPNEIYWLEDLEWVGVSDTVASCAYRFRWKAGVDGRTFTGTGRGTTVLKSESGPWKIIHEHLSLIPK